VIRGDIGLDHHAKQTWNSSMERYYSLSTLIPTLLFSKWTSITYGLFSFVGWFSGVVGFIDDYIKVGEKKIRGTSWKILK